MNKLKHLLVILALSCVVYAQPTLAPANFTKAANITVTWNGPVSMVCGSSAATTVTLNHYTVQGFMRHIAGTPDIPQLVEVYGLRLTAKPTGGTFVDRSGTINDGAGASTATMRDWLTAPDNSGVTPNDSSGGTFAAIPVYLATYSPTFSSQPIDIVPVGSPIVLRGPNDCIVAIVSHSDPIPPFVLQFTAAWREDFPTPPNP